MIDYSKHTVLIVDDEMEIIKALKRGLHLEPYKKCFASSGAEALEVIAEEGEISVIVTDMRMPGMNGLELLKKVDEICPGTIKIVLTGYTQLPQILATINHVEIYKFMTKPWDLDAELKVYIKEAIELYEKKSTIQSRLLSSEKKGELYSKLLNESYEKVDHLLKLYDELLKTLNQHHLLSMKTIREVESMEMMGEAIKSMNLRVHYINRIFELGRLSMKTFTLFELAEAIEKQSGYPLTIQDSETLWFDNFKMFSTIMDGLIGDALSNGLKPDRIFLSSEQSNGKSTIKLLLSGAISNLGQEASAAHHQLIGMILKIIGGTLEIEYDGEFAKYELVIPSKVKNMGN